MNKNILILTAVVTLIGFNAMYSPGGGQRALATSAIDNPGEPFTLLWYGKCTGISGNMDMASVTHTGSTGIYYGLRGNPATGHYKLYSRNTSYLEASYATAEASDDIFDTVVGVFESSTNKELWVNGAHVATLSTSSTLSTSADDLCLMNTCRSGGGTPGFQGTMASLAYCGRVLTDEEIVEYDNNKQDKDYVRQICARVPGTQFIFYPFTDMLVVEPGTAGGLGGKYVHENGYPIKDLGEGQHNAIAVVISGAGADTDGAFLTGTFDLQN